MAERKLIAIGLCLFSLAALSTEKKEKSAEEKKLEQNKTELKAYQKKVKALSDKVMDDVQDTVKQLNQEALDTQ